MKSLSQIREASGDKEAYQKFYNTLLKKFGVKSPAELEGDKKKKFFNAIDKGWEGDNEEPEPGDKKESVDENCGADHSGKGVCPECGKTLSEEAIAENMGGLGKAINSLSNKPEFKKIKKNLKSLSMRATETQMVYKNDKKATKKAAKQIATQLDKLIMKVDKKSASKLMKLADLATTYESVEVSEKVSTDCRTVGYKEAVKRALLRREKREAKKIAAQKLEDKKAAEVTAEEIANATGAAIAGHDKPLGMEMKRRKPKSFKEYK
jgi:hypothetical protein